MMGLSVNGSFTSFAPLTRRVCTSGLNGSSNSCDKAIELVTVVSSDLVMQLTLRSHDNITGIGGIVCKSHYEANSLHFGAGILMSTLLKRTPVWVFLPQILPGVLMLPDLFTKAPNTHEYSLDRHAA